LKHLQAVVERAMRVADFPLFVKPANLGSSVGITKCNTHADLVEGLMEAARYDRRVLIERGIPAREIEVSVLGNDMPKASVPGEILPSREFYSYEAKYIDDSSGLLIPAPISDALSERIRSLALRAYQAIDCAGMARVDFLLEKVDAASGRQPEIYLNEVNTIPGFTQISMYAKLWQASGLSYPALVDRLIELALERKAGETAQNALWRRAMRRNQQQSSPQRTTSSGSGAPRAQPRNKLGRRAPSHDPLSPPPVMTRNAALSGATRPLRRAKRRYDISLSAPGAEMRLPSLPIIYPGWRLVSFALVVLLAVVLYQFWNSAQYRVDAVDASVCNV
jgi:hypothetical protein